jgi:hypothetical protein
MKTTKLVATMVLLATTFSLSAFAAEPALSDDLETPDALIRGIINDDPSEETQIQLGENPDVEQLTQDPLIDSTKPNTTVDTTNSKPDTSKPELGSGLSDTELPAGSTEPDKEASLPTLAQKEVPSKKAVKQENKIKEKKPKKKWTSVFTRDTDEQRTDLETPDPLLDDF